MKLETVRLWHEFNQLVFQSKAIKQIPNAHNYKSRACLITKKCNLVSYFPIVLYINFIGNFSEELF